jgi:hypothetical protein
MPAAGTQLSGLTATLRPLVKFLPRGVQLVNPANGTPLASSALFAFGSGGISFPGGLDEIGIRYEGVGMFRLVQRGPDRRGFLALTGLEDGP